MDITCRHSYIRSAIAVFRCHCEGIMTEAIQKKVQRTTGLPHYRRSLVMTGFSPAFSLIEMLMALLVASLLLAALAPVMTRKMNENVVVSGTGNIITNKYCAFINDETETLEYLDENTGCVVPDGIYLASAIIASGGGGGGGAAGLGESKTGETTLIDNSSLIGSAQTFNGSTKSLKVLIAGAGGGGGGGAYYSDSSAKPEKQADCEPFGVYISASDNGGSAICVSKYNPGEGRDGSPDLIGVTSVPADGKTICNNGNCCWYGNNGGVYKTSRNDSFYSCDNSAGGITYSGCYRTACQYNAAVTVCKNWKPLGNEQTSVGRLPRKDEFDAWANSGKINNKGGKPGILNWNPDTGVGLQLCHASNILGGVPRCYVNTDTLSCAGAGGNTCDPPELWSSTLVEGYTNVRYRGDLGTTDGTDGIFRILTGADNDSFSVRCILDTVRIFKSATGGGGSSGAFVSINVPSQILAKALADGNGRGRVDTLAGKGGQGGAASTNSGLEGGDGEDGASSKIAIYAGGGNTYNSGGTLLWMLEVPGGYGAKGAASDEDGKDAKAVIKPRCKYYDVTNNLYNTNTSGHELYCENLPNKIITKPGNDGSMTTGGAGSWTNGTSSVFLTGAGGDGKTCTDKGGKEALCLSGDNGVSGRVLVTHIPTYPGVGGGGGAAGNVIHITNFTVNKGDVIKVTVGAGGAGGYGSANGSGANGTDGGASFIELPNGKKYGTYGGKGGLGGTKGEPSTTTAPIPGAGGEAQGLISGTKIPSEYIFKGEKGQNAPEIPEVFENMTSSPGGQGGINPKISALNPGDGGNNIPCGGLNTNDDIKVNDTTKWEASTSCITDSNNPFALTRALYANMFNYETIKNFSVGSTGGGGGGWMQGASVPAASGAKGMGGYVYIYFGDWNQKQ